LLLLFYMFDTSVYSSDVWTLYTTENSGIIKNEILSLAIEDNGSLWAGSSTGVSHFNGLTWNKMNTTAIFEIVIDKSNIKWFSTNFAIYKFENSTLLRIELPLYWNSDMNYYTPIALDKNSNVWFGNYNGVAKFDGNEWTTFGSVDNFLMNDVRDIAIDHDNIVWVARMGGGILL
jgi:ligand-binding sensor domain-containing protein